VTTPMLRPASPADVPTIERIVIAAYGKYTSRIGKPAGPMLDDYAALVEQGVVSIAESGNDVVGVLVLIPEDGYLLLDNIAIDPGYQGRGFGRALIDIAEREARRRGFGEVRLYTHVTMIENVTIYRHLGFSETHRATVNGYDRVYMQKLLAGG
jgi:ribosomal protein S18 acetylase RimI-like enzyme